MSYLPIFFLTVISLISIINGEIKKYKKHMSGFAEWLTKRKYVFVESINRWEDKEGMTYSTDDLRSEYLSLQKDI